MAHARYEGIPFASPQGSSNDTLSAYSETKRNERNSLGFFDFHREIRRSADGASYLHVRCRERSDRIEDVIEIYSPGQRIVRVVPFIKVNDPHDPGNVAAKASAADLCIRARRLYANGADITSLLALQPAMA